MELDAILAALEEYNDRTFPREALAQAIAHKEEIKPLLLDVFRNPAAKLEEIANQPSYFLHLYSLFLLAQFRETQAYPLIVEFFSIPGETVLDVTGDTVTEDLGRILASVYDGDLAPIKRLIEDTRVNEEVRVAGLSALTTLVVENVISRESVLEYFKELFPIAEKEEEDVFISSLILVSTGLYPDEELLTLLRSAFEKNLVDEMLILFEEIEEVIEAGPEKALAYLQERRHYHFVEDTIAEMEWWACFQEVEFNKAPQIAASLSWDQNASRGKLKGTVRKKKRKAQKQSRKRNRPKKKK